MKTLLLHLHVIILFLLLQILPSISAVKYQVINDARNTYGGSRFNSEIGINYTLQIMKTINNFIWDTFEQYNETDRKNNVDTVKVSINQYTVFEAETYGETINVSSNHLAGYKGNLRREYTSLLVHEMTHVFQWEGGGKAPSGLLEGVADYMMLEANYTPPDFAMPGEGEGWDEGYDITARFLEYCEELKPRFVAGLNKMMKDDFSESYFKDLTGKPVKGLWADYKAKYPYNG